MKPFVALVALQMAIAPAAAIAQLPNAGFENWTGGLPDGWITDNAPGLYTPITQTTSAHSGTSALHATVVGVSLGGGEAVPMVPWFFTGFSISQRYASVGGYYTFTSIKADSMYGFAILYAKGLPIGSMTMGGRTTRSSYQHFVSNIEYFTSDVPDSCVLWFGIDGKDTVHIGSSFKLDDLELTGLASGVDIQATVPQTFALDQNYPNPFNPSTVIGYRLPVASTVDLKIFDLLGREVTTLVNERKEAGRYQATFSAAGLASGTYLCRLASAGGVQVRKMILQK